MKHKHANFIDKLGGPTTVSQALGLGSSQRVSNWRTRGVSWVYRNDVAALANRQGVNIPKGFLNVPKK